MLMFGLPKLMEDSSKLLLGCAMLPFGSVMLTDEAEKVKFIRGKWVF